MKQHLCFVTKYYGVPKNGPSTFAHNFIKRVVNDSRYDVTVISGETNQSIYGEKIVSYKSKHHVLDGFKIRKLLKRISKEKKIDIIYFNCFRNAIFSSNIQIPYYLNVNDHHPFIKEKSDIWKKKGGGYLITLK
ncbi:hypothetical protein D7Z54_29500 [Salibacterium salarium]|uniref:Glycosyltransferase subfamily 4-like N-terminal domain-containing protein n=1 Tax=Salibacterium salarium TaxID=284579 RepID=A0A428MUF8_9BACI|nr:hypothetical protein [Salibacterium salarium]RSL29769.1 hypothetical protein D7Z54_29500 [Salibacterium salarium]